MEFIEVAEQHDEPEPGRRRSDGHRGLALGVVVGVVVLLAVLVVNDDPDTSGSDRNGRPGDADAASSTSSETTVPARTSPSTTQAVVGSLEDPPVAALARRVGDVSFALTLPKTGPAGGRLGWSPGPVMRASDGTGFRAGDLYLSRDIVGPQAAEAVVFWTGFPDGGDADPCANLVNPPPGPTAADLAATVAAAPGTELIDGPLDVTIGGRPATYVALTVREDVGCEPGFFFTWVDGQLGPFWPGTDVGATIRMWIIAVDGTRLVIEAENATHRSDLDEEIQQLVDSIRFG